MSSGNATARDASSPNRLRILVADDHKPMRDSLVAMLSKKFEVVAAVADGGEVVTTAERVDPDVLVLDIAMPVMSGIAQRLVSKLPDRPLASCSSRRTTIPSSSRSRRRSESSDSSSRIAWCRIWSPRSTRSSQVAHSPRRSAAADSHLPLSCGARRRGR